MLRVFAENRRRQLQAFEFLATHPSSRRRVHLSAGVRAEAGPSAGLDTQHTRWIGRRLQSEDETE